MRDRLSASRNNRTVSRHLRYSGKGSIAYIAHRSHGIVMDDELYLGDDGSMDERKKARRKASKHGTRDSDMVNGVHVALASCHRYPPPPRRIRPPFAPWKINSKLFIVCRIRPFPEWPLICRQENRMAFDDEKSAKAWSAKHAPMCSIWNIWTCDFCTKVHFVPYPLEITGTSGGKDIRKQNFLLTHDNRC